MALCLPCGDGVLLDELRQLGVPAVGIDADPDAVQRCRAAGFVAYRASWPDLTGYRQRFDAIVADVRALDLAPDGLAACCAVLAAALLPGGRLVLRGAMTPPSPLPAMLAVSAARPDGLVLRRTPKAVPAATGLVVGPYADLFVGCGSVLEVGAGTGRFLHALAMRDLAVAGIEQDAGLAAAARAEGLPVATGGLERFGDATGRHGGVHVGNVVEALADHELPLLLRACRHALQPGGRLVLRARRGAEQLDRLLALMPAHGFAFVRRGSAPGDDTDDFAVALADRLAPPPLPAGLERIALPTGGLRLHQPLRSRFDLERCERRITSQTGEDGALAALFSLVGTTDRHYVEFGCGDGVQCNTAQLRLLGWRGLLLDGVAAPGAPGVVIHTAWITAENIEALFDAHGVPAEPDLMSIDLDGNDYWVWRAIRRRPRVVVAEYNANLGCDEALTIPYDPQHRWDGSDYYGASLPALVALARRKGYTLVHCTQSGVNAIFVRDDLLGGEAPRELARIYRPPNYWYRGARQHPDLGRPWIRPE